jgi:hypothetical protein
MVHRPLISCNRGPLEFRPRLHLPPSQKASGILELPLGSGGDCSPGKAGGIRDVSRQRRLDGDATRRLGAPCWGPAYSRPS